MRGRVTGEAVAVMAAPCKCVRYGGSESSARTPGVYCRRCRGLVRARESYEPVGESEALALIARHLRALSEVDRSNLLSGVETIDDHLIELEMAFHEFFARNPVLPVVDAEGGA